MKKQEGFKSKDIIELVVALLVFLVAAYFIYGLLSPSKAKSGSSSGTTVTVVSPLQTDFDQSALQAITDPAQTQDFYTPPDLHSGLNNPEPFGQTSND